MSGFPGGSVVKNLPTVQETQVRSLGKSPGEGNGNPLQYSCLENPMDRGAWWSTVTKSQPEMSTTTHYLHVRKQLEFIPGKE